MNVVTHFKDGTAFFVKPEECIGVEVIGVKLQRKLPAMTKTERAILGHKLRTGPMRFGPRQASRFAEVEMKYIRTVAKATQGEWWALEYGFLTVEDLHARQLAARRRSDAVVDKRIAKIGVDLALASIDRLTAPATNGAEMPPAMLATNGMAAPANNDDDDDEPADWWKEIHTKLHASV